MTIVFDNLPHPEPVDLDKGILSRASMAEVEYAASSSQLNSYHLKCGH